MGATFEFKGRTFDNIFDAHDEVVIAFLSNDGAARQVDIERLLTVHDNLSLAILILDHWDDTIPWLSREELIEAIEAAREDLPGFMGWETEKDIKLPKYPHEIRPPKKMGRPKAHPLILKTPRYIKLPEWLWQWMDSPRRGRKKRPQLIEQAMMAHYGIGPPKVKK